MTMPDGPPLDATTLRRIGWLGAGLLGVQAVALLYVVGAALPFNPVRPPGHEQLSLPLRVVVPEGWAFFTRNPREEALTVFRQEGGSFRDWTPPYLSAANLLGIRRLTRARTVEVGRLLYGIAPSRWTRCERDVRQCLAEAPLAMTVVNTARQPETCGVFGFLSREPVPWAWTRRRAEMPGRVLKLEVKCP